MADDNLARLIKAELLLMAREADIKGRSRMTKAELVAALTAAESEEDDEKPALRSVNLVQHASH